MRHYPDFIDAFVDYAKDIEAPPAYLRWSALSIVAGALERKVWIKRGKWTYYPNLFVMLVGNAGVRKTSASQAAIDILKEVPEVAWLPTKLNEATIIKSLADIGMKKKYNFCGEEFRMSSGFLYSSEASSTFKDMYKGGGIIEFLTDMYDGGTPGWSEKIAWSKSTLTHGLEPIYNPLLNFLACTTPAMLPQLVSRSDAMGGFGSRTLLVVHKGEYERSFAWHEESVDDVETRRKLISDLSRIHLLKGAYAPTPEFKILFSELDKMHSQRLQSSSQHPLIMGFLTRMPAHAAKIAQILAASRRNELSVNHHDLRDAWNLLGDLEPLMLEAYGEIAVTPQARARNEIWDYIKRRPQGRFLKSEVQQHFQQTLEMRAVSAILSELCEMGKISFIGAESRAGRFVYQRIDV